MGRAVANTHASQISRQWVGDGIVAVNEIRVVRTPMDCQPRSAATYVTYDVATPYCQNGILGFIWFGNLALISGSADVKISLRRKAGGVSTIWM